MPVMCNLRLDQGHARLQHCNVDTVVLSRVAVESADSRRLA